MLPISGSGRHLVAGCGVYRWAAASNVSGFTWRSAEMSSTHRLRPCVATTISPAVGWIATSWIATVGRLLLIFVQVAPRFVEAKQANSVPQNKRFWLIGSSRRQRDEPNSGKLLVIGFHVSPNFSVTKQYGLSSSERCASKQT